jgi:hypothetical protein
MDRQFMQQFGEEAEDLTEEVVATFAVKYGVVRCFPGSGAARFKPVAAYLNNERKERLSTRVNERKEDMITHVENFASFLQETFGRYNLGAASKFMWMVNPSQVIIYDSYVLKALQKEAGAAKIKPRDYKGIVPLGDSLGTLTTFPQLSQRFLILPTVFRIFKKCLQKKSQQLKVAGFVSD